MNQTRIPNELSKKMMDEVEGHEVYAWLTAYFLHQDQLSWSRTQTLVAVEAGAIAGAFALRGLIYASVPLLLGTAVLWCIWLLIRRDWDIRDQDLAILDLAHEPIGIRITHPAKKKQESASWLMPKIVWGLVITNGVLAIILPFA